MKAMIKPNFFSTAKKLFLLGCATLATCYLSAQTVDVKGKADSFEHYWSACVGAGRANEGLRAGWLEQLDVVKKNCGFQYVRFHGLFHDDMFVYFPKKDGKAAYIALFLKKALETRLPETSDLEKPVSLKKLNPQDGWLFSSESRLYE